MREDAHLHSLPFCSHSRGRERSQQTFRTLLRPLPILLAVLSLITGTTTASAADKKVLFLYADKSNGGMVAYREVVQTDMRAGSPDRITFYEEYMDLSQYPGEEYLSVLRSFYRQKYQGQRFDLIIAQAGSVLNFLTKYGEELFPNTPIVFGSLEKNRIEGLTLGPNITGILMDAGFGATLEAALKMQPDVRNVVVVSGASEVDAKHLAKASSQFRSFEGRVEFTYLTGLPMEELEKRLANLPAHTIIFYVTLLRDGAGQAFSVMESVARIASASNAPIYSIIDRLIEVGSIGGFVLSMEADGKEVAKVAKRVLSGEKPADIPIRAGDTNRYMFDWRQLRRWNIDEHRLPSGSVLLFREPTLWEMYKWRIVAVISLCVVEALLIVWLLITRNRRRRAEEANKSLAAIVESSDDAILSETLEGTITSWNAGAEKIFGYSASEMRGQHISTLAPTEQKEEVLRILEQIELGERVDHLETVRMTREGRRVEVSLTISPIKDDHGVIIGASTIARDITRRKQAEVEGIRQRAELAHLSRVTMLGELSSSLAHELNQPLGAILRNTEAAELFLQEPSPDLEELRSILADIRKDDERAGAVIDRMRALVKRSEIEHSLLDLNLLANEVISLVRPDADSRKVRLTLEPASSLPPVFGDRVQLQQVLLNLLLNAIHAVNDSALDRRRVTVRVKPAGKQVDVVVSDTGHGIPTDKLPRLFEPFFTTKQNGMGMGLPISRTIMKAHLGSIRAENDPAGGAMFCFTLPVAGEGSAS